MGSDFHKCFVVFTAPNRASTSAVWIKLIVQIFVFRDSLLPNFSLWKRTKEIVLILLRRFQFARFLIKFDKF